LKLTLIQTHLIEMVATKHRSKVIMAITFATVCLVLIVGLFYKFIDNRTDSLLNMFAIIGICASLIYMLIAPESPQWLLGKEGPNS
jgi:hypothetical protein